jgi:hypothetical protein
MWRETPSTARTFVAFEGTRLHRLLDDDIEEALMGAIAVVDDQFTEEIASRFIAPGSEYVGVFSDQHLPQMHRSSYSAGFVRGLHVCFIQVVAHLTTDPWVGLACRGEEFVLDALLNQTRILAELEELPAAPMAKLEHALAQLAEEAFDDFDFAFAFDPAADGIDDPETELGRQVGMSMRLHPRYWFEPIGDLPVHPLASSWAI